MARARITLGTVHHFFGGVHGVLTAPSMFRPPVTLDETL